jgi:hypothetical protein
MKKTNYTLFAVLCMAIPTPSSAASVTGTVVDENGKPINKARVSIHLRAGAGMLVHPSSTAPKGRIAPARAFNSFTQSDSRGGFAFANVPAGLVQVCVQTDDRLQFDACLWDGSSNYFEFPATKDVNLPAVRVESGYLLSVTVSDNKSYLSARDFTKARSPLAEEVLVSIRSPIMGFIPIQPKAQGQNRVFEYVIPYNKPIPLNISAPGLQLKDSATAKQTLRFSQVIRIDKKAPKSFNFSLEKAN